MRSLLPFLTMVLAVTPEGGLWAQTPQSRRTVPVDRRLAGEDRSPRNPAGLDRRGTPERTPDRPQPVGPAASLRRAPVRGSMTVLTPRYLPPCYVFPTATFWGQRDIMAEIQWHARQGFVPVTPVPEDASELSGVSDFPAGWKVYGIAVPPGGKLHVRLHHPNEGWFRLSMVNKWGDLEAGMLQNRIYTGNPEVRYTNPQKEPRVVYVIVDDPGWMSSKAYPYALNITKDWEAGREDLREIKPVQGIWASNPLEDISAEHGRHAALVW